jgi:hypothetical protein
MLETSDYTTDYRHQDPNRNEERTNKKRRRKPQMDKKKEKQRPPMKIRIQKEMKCTNEKKYVTEK